MQDWFPSQATGRHRPGDSGLPALTIERCGFRYLGLRSRAVHVNGFTHDGRLMVGQRAESKSQDPGLFDNLMAGGISSGETWEQTLQRELYEEASIVRDRTAASIVLTGILDTCRQDHDVWHSETLVVCNLLLAPDESPLNQDGEVQRFLRMSAPETIQRMKDGQFTRDGIISLAHGLGLRPDP
jgi:8-oxo-dGTP pyrophosphatase MutT (NUDIX family)